MASICGNSVAYIEGRYSKYQQWKSAHVYNTSGFTFIRSKIEMKNFGHPWGEKHAEFWTTPIAEKYSMPFSKTKRISRFFF